MTRTPDEIKKGLECCMGDPLVWHCDECPYAEDGAETDDGCDNNGAQVMQDALAYISQLESQNRCFKEIKESCEKRMIEMAQRMPSWISVEDEYPDSKRAVLGYGFRSKRYGEYDIFPAVHVVYTRGEDEGWFTFWNDEYVAVTHWMPLPEPPSEN